MNHYTKAIVAVLTMLVNVTAIWWPPVAQIVSPETVVTLSSIIGSILVYQLPNKPAGT